MYYEHFLFTRNTRRDFTAFIRPAETTNADVSALASVIGYVNNISWLTQQHPAFYCFPLGAYIYLLRHYNSGRQHAGREIAVLEGVAVRRTQTRTFARHIHTMLRAHDAYLNPTNSIANIEAQQVTESKRHSLSITMINPSPPSPQDAETVAAFATQQNETRLHVPFTPVGLNLLATVLNEPTIPPLIRFAFGTNSDVVRRLAALEVDLDVVGYFRHERPSLKSRETSETVQVFETYDKLAFTPPARPPTPPPGDRPLRGQKRKNTASEVLPERGGGSVPLEEQSSFSEAPSEPDQEQRGVLTPRQMRQRARDMAAANIPIDTDEDAAQAEEALFEGEVLTPRQMRRRIMEAEAAKAAEAQDETTHNWLVGLIKRLFGRS